MARLLFSAACLLFVPFIMLGGKTVFLSDSRVRVLSNAAPGWYLRGEVKAVLAGRFYLRAGSVWIPDRGDAAVLGSGVRIIAPGFTLLAPRGIFNRRDRILFFCNAVRFDGVTLSGSRLTNVRLLYADRKPVGSGKGGP